MELSIKSQIVKACTILGVVLTVALSMPLSAYADSVYIWQNWAYVGEYQCRYSKGSFTQVKPFVEQEDAFTFFDEYKGTGKRWESTSSTITAGFAPDTTAQGANGVSVYLNKFFNSFGVEQNTLTAFQIWFILGVRFTTNVDYAELSTTTEITLNNSMDEPMTKRSYVVGAADYNRWLYLAVYCSAENVAFDLDGMSTLDLYFDDAGQNDSGLYIDRVTLGITENSIIECYFDQWGDSYIPPELDDLTTVRSPDLDILDRVTLPKITLAVPDEYRNKRLLSYTYDRYYPILVAVVVPPLTYAVVKVYMWKE